jgi:uroporphyrinogen decarboxylase
MRKQIQFPVALQGNLDPDALYAPLNRLEKEVQHILTAMRGDEGFIFNLGHGISPDVSEEAVRTVIDCVKRQNRCPSIL